MAVTGKTQKFQSLSNQVKSQTQPRVKLISEDQITQLFDDFGYQPERADLTYWSHQPETAKTKLVNELKARRDEEKASQKEQQTKQQGPNHLTDQQITSIYSEFGFPTPKSGSDFNWIRQNFPDDEQKLRVILDTKRKEMDQMMKIKSKNMVDNVKQSSSMMQPSPQNSMMFNQGQGGQYNGQGGPGDGTTDNTSGGTKWFFPSRYSVVKFSSDPNGSEPGDATTLWLLDSNSKQLHPFLSMEGFNNFFGETAQAALKSVVNLNPNDILPGGPGEGFNLLGSSYGINNSGQVPVLDANPQQIKSLYGKTPDDQAVTSAYTVLDGFLDLLNKNNGAGINNSMIGNILNDQTQMAKYINALAYGGYSLSDVYSDIKRKELINNGDQSLSQIQVIDPSLTKQEFLKTNNGQMSQGIATIMPPASIGNINTSILNSPITQLPQEAFKTLVPPLDMNSQAFKDQMNNVQSAFHDILIDQVNATTEAEKAIADQKYQDYRDYIEKNYGIKMSMNLVQGWQQLQQIMSQSNAAGLAGSGIEAGQIDNALREVRTQDKKWREIQSKDINAAQNPLIQSSASPAEIQKMNQEDAAKGLPKTEWRAYKLGLVPSDDVLSSLDINTLKQKYPNTSEENLQQMRSQILDENGNYRSTLYQNKIDQLAKIKYGGTMSDKFPSIGSEQSYKENTVYSKNLAEQAKAAAPYTQTDPKDPWGNLGKSTTNIPSNLTNKLTTQTPESTAPKFDTGAPDQARIDAANAAKNISQNITTPTIPKQTSTSSPSGMTYIPNVASMKNFTDITKPDASGKLYGIPKTQSPSITTDATMGRTKIPNLDIMKKYNPNQYDRIGTSVYLKQGVKQNW